MITQGLPSQERLNEMFSLNDGDLVWRIRPKCHPRMFGKVAGSERKASSGKFYRHIRLGGGLRVLRSHIVFCMTRGRWPSLQIDHINGDSLCDHPDNLREATATQNAWNHKRRAKKSPLPMGVRETAYGRFVARISVNKTHKTIGTFNSVEQAREAYLQARSNFFGEFA